MSEQLKEFFSEIMDLSAPYSIEKIVRDQASSNRVDIYLKIEQGFRPSKFDKLHSYKTRTWQHLDIMQYSCYVHCKIPIYYNTRKDRHELLEVPWARKGSGFTLLFERRVLDLLKLTGCKKTTADFFGLYPQRIECIYDAYTLAPYQSREITGAKRIALDETSTKKGHEYISIFWDMDDDKLLDIREGKSSEVVSEYIEELRITGQHPKETIKEIVCDMSPAFAKGIRENLPNTKVTFDRFHVVSLIHRYLDPLKKNKKIKWEILDYHIQELDQLWIQKSEIKAASFLSYWMDRSIELFGLTKLVKSLSKHFHGIIAFCRTKLTNGKLEGLNNKVQWIKRVARGYRSKENFMRMIYFIIGNLNTDYQTKS